jgi:tRNA(Ile)-lysidine synthase
MLIFYLKEQRLRQAMAIIKHTHANPKCPAPLRGRQLAKVFTPTHAALGRHKVPPEGSRNLLRIRKRFLEPSGEFCFSWVWARWRWKRVKLRERLKPLEWGVFQEIRKSFDLQREERILLAVSGGLDSVVLAQVAARLRGHLPKWTWEVAHVHHGLSANAPEQNQARNQAEILVACLAADLGFSFHLLSHSGSEVLKSEEALRDFRLNALKELAEKQKITLIALAHHRDDLLETRLIRLIRGTGPGGLQAMELRSPSGLWRPFLNLSRVEIQNYANEENLKWWNDPSNLQSEPLRNWLRLEWLPMLEKKRPGAAKSLARSLELLTDSLAEQVASSSGKPEAVSDAIQSNSTDIGLDRQLFKQLGPAQQSSLLVKYIRGLGVRGFGRTHVQEILKRLDTPQKNFMFNVADLHWKINAEQIVANWPSELAAQLDD